MTAAKTEYAEMIPKGGSYTPPAGSGAGTKADLGALSMEEYIKERSK